MNKNPGLLGLKLGMTQLVADDGTITPCTVVHAASVVVGKRTQEKNGYDALVLGFGERKAKRTSKPLAGQFKVAGPAKEGEEATKVELPLKHTLREFRCSAEYAAKFELGQELKVDEVFSEGQFVDVRAQSRGRGFTGVMRRHNFHGAGASHGAHEVKRHGGSIGTNMTPGRVKPGVKMAGQHGNQTVSVLSQPIVKLLADKQLILVSGGIPGSRNRVVEIRGAVKKRAKVD
jgi:large subunit ribosomal protein L3